MIKTILKEKFIEEQWVVESLVCDCCGASCPKPDKDNWSDVPWMRTSVLFRVYETVDGDDTGRSVDLCPECAGRIMDDIKKGEIKYEPAAKENNDE